MTAAEEIIRPAWLIELYKIGFNLVPLDEDGKPAIAWTDIYENVNYLNPQHQQNDISLIKSTAEELRDNGTKRIAFLMSDRFRVNDCECINTFEELGWSVLRHIQCPLSKSLYNDKQVERARRELKLLPLARSLVIFENTLVSQSHKEVSA